MYVHVKLLNGFHQTLLYAVPPALQPAVRVGTLVQIPLRAQETTAFITKILPQKPRTTFAIKDVKALTALPADPHYRPFIKQLTDYYCLPEQLCIERIHQFLLQESKRARKTKIKAAVEASTYQPSTLTDEQQAVADFVAQAIEHPAYTPTLLHGITGSGKTEIYKAAIIKAIAHKKSVILMLPEVTLSMQFHTLLQQQLPSDITLYSFHSAVTTTEKRALWQRLIAGEPTVIVGVHLPILLPIANLGLIIVDEEHEVGYQEKKHPKINSKDAAILRAHCAAIPILLGSATPSVSSLYNVATKGWRYFTLNKRFGGTLPTIKTVSLLDKRKRKHFWISIELYGAITQCLARKEQAIIFMNRRGFSFFVQCKACSYIFSCSNCSVSLTLHNDNMLSCHYCGIRAAHPATCTQCKASDFLKKGIGTQQVVAILETLFPHARIARADLDTTVKKKSWQKTMQQFKAGDIDILVGTQTITKGFHFPRVTLVGIIWADLNLNFPRYNASEITLQQLIQVAGRAGRSAQTSTVIMQTMADHPIFSYTQEIDYAKFYEEELATRKAVGYPPCTRIAEIELKFHDEQTVEKEAHDVVSFLKHMVTTEQYAVTILGPAKPPVHKIKNMHTRIIYLKGMQHTQMNMLYKSAQKQVYKSRIYYTPNPVS